MRVLALDTCGPEIGVALWVDGVVDARATRVARGAEALLIPWAQELLAARDLTFDDLDGVGVARGPGAFTGLRVGLATALGLAVAAKLPVVAIDSLQARAASRPGVVLAMLDARKQRVYAALFSDGVPLTDAVDELPDVVLAAMAPGFLATGEGAEVYRALVEQHGGVVVQDATACGVATLARLAAEALARGEGQDPQHIQPVYLRAPDAVPPKQR